MRQRFAENGFENYRPHEVLEQLLFHVIPRANTNETAHALLDRFGSLENVLDAEPAELTEIPGIGIKAAEYLTSVKMRFAERVIAEYRESGSFDSVNLAFLAGILLNDRNSDRILLAVFDELGNFLRVDLPEAVRNPNGGIALTETARNIADAAAGLEFAAVTILTELTDPERSAVLYRSVRAAGGKLCQFLLYENGDLYDLLSRED